MTLVQNLRRMAKSTRAAKREKAGKKQALAKAKANAKANAKAQPKAGARSRRLSSPSKPKSPTSQATRGDSSSATGIETEEEAQQTGTPQVRLTTEQQEAFERQRVQAMTPDEKSDPTPQAKAKAKERLTAAKLPGIGEDWAPDQGSELSELLSGSVDAQPICYECEGEEG